MGTKKIQIIGTINNNIQTKADWSQNDPEAPDYVKGRTHYEDGETVYQLDEKFIPDSIARKSDISAGGGVDVTGAKVGQIIQVESVDETGKPTAWKAVDKPAKLSDLKNDLFYANATEALTITKADFSPKYVLDDEGNPTDEIECFYYKGTPALDWFTSPDKIGFVIQFTDGDEPVAINHHVPNVTAQWDDSQWTYQGYFDEEGPSAPFIVCDECGLAIMNEANPLNSDGPVPENAFYIQVFGWWDEAGVGFDSITIYQVDSKKIPKELYDDSEIVENINNMYNDTMDRIFYLESSGLKIGQPWMNLPFDTFEFGKSITYGNGIYVAVGSKGVAVSQDSKRWTIAEAPMPGTYGPNITYGNGVFVIGYYNNIRPFDSSVWYSSNGIDWRAATCDGLKDTAILGIFFDGSRFICATIGAYAPGRTCMLESFDGASWTIIPNCDGFLAPGNNAQTVIFARNEDKIVAVQGTKTDSISCSTDGGVTWVDSILPSANYNYSLIYGDGLFILTCDKCVLYSQDGLEWSKTDISTNGYMSVVYGNGMYLIWDDTLNYPYSKLFRSYDGVNWELLGAKTDKIVDVTYDGKKFVMLKKNGPSGIYHTVDGSVVNYNYNAIYNGDVDVTEEIKEILDLDVDLGGYATKDEIPTKTSQLTNDSGFLTEHQDLTDYAKKTDIPAIPVQSVNGKTGAVSLSASDVGAEDSGTANSVVSAHNASPDSHADIRELISELFGQNLSLDTALTKSGEAADAKAVGDAIKRVEEKIPSIEGLALKTEIPAVPVQSVNDKTGAVRLGAADVGARPDTWMPTAQEVGADPKGTAAATVSVHNTNSTAHNDIRQELAAINARLTAFFDSDNQTLDELSEIVAYITSNKSLIDAITTSKVSVADIVNNLTTNVANKPLSAAQGVALKALIDAVSNSLNSYALKTELPTKLSQLSEDSTHRMVTDAEKTAWNAKSNFSGKYADLSGKPTKVSEFTNDAGYLTEHQDISGKADKFDPTVYGLPVIWLTGDTAPIAVSKDNKVNMSYVYGERSGTAKLKGQGATSYKTAQALVQAGKAGKFNYTITFDEAFEAFPGWGAQKKYCLKANFIDPTQSRNICSCKLWGMSTKARSVVPPELANLPNGGAIDGFPIIIMLNGEFHGLYTWNIPKDGWMFGLVEDASKTQAIVSASDHTAATQFKEASMSGFEVEFVSDEDNADWVQTSLTRMIAAVVNSNGSDLDTTVAQYLDWDSWIDHFIHTVVDKATDCVDKNYNLVTFDGVKWYVSAYDRDSIHGLEWDASGLSRPVSNCSFTECALTVRVYELILRFKTNRLKARYKELRGNILSESRIMQVFENFAWAIPSPVKQEDVKKYPTILGSDVNTIDQIGRFVRQRLETSDKWVDALPAQEEPPTSEPEEPEQPAEMVNQVPISTDTDGSIYNGTGYKDNARLSSSGGVSSSAQTGSVVTGFIPYTKDAVIRMKGAKWLGMYEEQPSHHYYLNFYDSSKALIDQCAVSTGGYADGTWGAWATYDAATGVTTFDFSGASSATTGFFGRMANAAYFRLNAYGKGSDLIVTVNQEITA